MYKKLIALLVMFLSVTVVLLFVLRIVFPFNRLMSASPQIPVTNVAHKFALCRTLVTSPPLPPVEELRPPASVN